MNNPMKPGSNVRVLSLFSGAGGLDIGFEEAGYNVVYASDLDGDCCNTLRSNLGSFLSHDAIIEQRDIRELKVDTLPKNVGLVIGGPPCQTFSASGRRAGGAAGTLDARGNLFAAYCRIIRHVKPRAFVFENVRGILATNKGKDWAEIANEFGKLGYKLNFRILDALDYGAPQQRERLFLVGHRLKGDFLFPKPLYGPDSTSGEPHVSAKQALQQIAEDEDVSLLKLEGGKYSHLLALVPPGGNYLHFTAKRGHSSPIFAYRSRFSDFLYKAHPDLPIKTIIARPGKYTGPLHWENRYFSVREYMRLQGFPDNYVFSGTRDDKIRQIGNSVSPKVAHQIARAIARQIFNVECRVELLESNERLTFDRRKGAKAAKTRAAHEAISKQRLETAVSVSHTFKKENYTATVQPTKIDEGNALCRAHNNGVLIQAFYGDSYTAFSRIQLSIFESSDMLGKPLKLDVTAFGKSPRTIETMWNAVDVWVRRSSAFHSLFELYGHFTEPHPVFKIDQFIAYSDHPIAQFAGMAANFKNCSRYFEKSDLIKRFGKMLGTKDFASIAEYVRGFRFDLRSQETNIAIDPNSCMIAYPFTLPERKQMNFRAKPRPQKTKSTRAQIAAE